jgi:hypothetical protein
VKMLFGLSSNPHTSRLHICEQIRPDDPTS